MIQDDCYSWWESKRLGYVRTIELMWGNVKVLALVVGGRFIDTYYIFKTN